MFVSLAHISVAVARLDSRMRKDTGQTAVVASLTAIGGDLDLDLLCFLVPALPCSWWWASPGLRQTHTRAPSVPSLTASHVIGVAVYHGTCVFAKAIWAQAPCFGTELLDESRSPHTPAVVLWPCWSLFKAILTSISGMPTGWRTCSHCGWWWLLLPLHQAPSTSYQASHSAPSLRRSIQTSMGRNQNKRTQYSPRQDREGVDPLPAQDHQLKTLLSRMPEESGGVCPYPPRTMATRQASRRAKRQNASSAWRLWTRRTVWM